LRQQTGKSSVYPDDCGAWDSHSRRTVKTDFTVLPDDSLRYTVLKDEKYCYEKQVKGKKTFVPLDPQPEHDNVVTLTRYYTPLKRDKNFKKRVSTFNCFPARHSLRENVALVEYTGTYPKSSQTHGNAKHVSHDYVRTHPDVFEEMHQAIQNKRSTIDIYKDMVLQNPEKAPRDLQQIRSKKFHDKKNVTMGTSNIADQVLETLSMVNDHDFVQESVYINGNNKRPSLICYTQTRLEDMKRHIQSDPSCTIGVDRTFNLGPAYVTNFVYKNKKVVKKSSRDNPIFLGPVFFRWDASYFTYNTFFSHVKARFLKNRNLSTKMIQSSDGKLTVPNVKRLARKPGQRHRPKTVAARIITRYT
jgi:hypothetical protein